jgi:O-antigen ligase
VGRFRPWLLGGMTALLVARSLFPSESAAEGDGLPTVMLWLVLAVLWLLGEIGRKRFTLRFGPVDVAVLVLVAWQCLAALYAVRHGSPRPALNMLWEWAGLGMVFFLARQFICDSHAARAVVAAMIALMTAISAYGIYQYAIELPAQQSQYLADKEGMLREAGLNYPPGTPVREMFERRLANREPPGTFALTNSLAAALAPWLVIGLWIAAAAWPERRRIAWRMLICLVPVAICLLLTRSRSGYAAAAVGFLWLALRGGWRNRRPAVRLAIAAAFVALLAAAATFASFAKPNLASLGYRVQYWRATANLIAHRPWLGCGPGNFQDVYTQYKLPEASEEVADPHNFLLEVWATAGTPAMLILLGILGLFGLYVMGGTSQSLRRWETAEKIEADTRCSTEYSVLSTIRRVPARLFQRSRWAWKPRDQALGKLEDLPPDDWKCAWWHVLAGMIGGFLLSLLMGRFLATPPNIAAVLIGLPVAVVCMLLLIPWVRSGTFPLALAGVGVAVLLVDLLTTSGIGFPAVAQSLWLLLALGLDGAWSREVPRAMATALLAVGLGLTVTCQQTSYTRVLSCQGPLRLAQQEYHDGHGQSALELAKRAAAADPYSSDAHTLLAELYLDAWLAMLDAADYDAFEAQDALARRTAPAAAPIWRASADRYRRAFVKTDAQGRHLQPHAIEKAIEIARQTTDLYPGSGADRAALAEIYQLSGDEADYRREAHAALELDRRMPHEEKKLPDALRRKLEAVE